MDTRDIARKLEQFLRQSFQIADDDPAFTRSVDLFEAGYVDSIGIIETLAYITKTFGVEVPDEALLSKVFASIDGMAQVIAELMEGDAGTAASAS